MRLDLAFAHSRGHFHDLLRLGDAIEQAGHSAAHEAWFSTAHSRTRPVIAQQGWGTPWAAAHPSLSSWARSPRRPSRRTPILLAHSSGSTTQCAKCSPFQKEELLRCEAEEKKTRECNRQDRKSTRLNSS